MSNQIPYAKLLLEWYDCHQRTLPWRAKVGEKPNPYHVLLSEIMLQQTQVTTVIPYFYRFIEKFPTLAALAKADIDEVMALWTGLGYYSRARNLHRCAGEIMQQGGVIPASPEALKKLSGIGAYTSAAIAAIGFNVPVVPIDGNVERVTARLFAVQEALPKARKHLDALAATLNAGQAAQERAGDFAQALFDIGATICRPKNPSCLICPLASLCQGYKEKIAETLPRRLPKTIRPLRYGSAFFIQDEQGRILLRKRPVKGLLAGTLELPETAWESEPFTLEMAQAQLAYSGNWQKKGQVKHSFTHFTLLIDIYGLKEPLQIKDRQVGDGWYDLASLEQQPLSSLMKKAIQLALKEKSLKDRK